MNENIIALDRLGMGDLLRVGGKNASLGEMIGALSSMGVEVPGGFATTAAAFRNFLQHNHLGERINGLLTTLNTDDVTSLATAGSTIRQWMLETPFPEDLEEAIRAGYEMMSAESRGDITVAVRSSATAEDLPDASFAGQQETFLNVRGVEGVLQAVKAVFASLYNDRAISYRVHKGFAHADVALSAGIQRMVRSETGASGVMFTLDTESGFRDVVLITSSYGLGEAVVQGAVNPDEFYVHKETLLQGRPAVLRRTLGSKALKMIYDDHSTIGKTIKTVDVPASDRNRFSLTDPQLEQLARMAVTIEQHYQRPMDIEWALDGDDGRLYILQARPETVRSQESETSIESFKLREKGELLCEGRAIGSRIGRGAARIVHSIDEMDRVSTGDILVTDMTDPDWEPVMKRASAIITNRGGRTCHAAIIARELGIPAVVGCGDATTKISEGQEVTASCNEGDTGYIYRGLLRFDIEQRQAKPTPQLPVKLMMNVGNPDRAFDFAAIPNEGVGLARLEFIINRMIGIHPLALLEFDQQTPELQQQILQLTSAYRDPVSFYVERLVEGISTLAATFSGKPVIVRMSDFKSNEYANLLGGERYEPVEENPMIGFRGTSRYISESFRPAFQLECRALRTVRDKMGLTNVEIMIPFVRTLNEAQAVVKLLADNGLERGRNGLRLIMMCELPSNAILADEFLDYFDGFSIGSNDMTQLTLGLDRDSGLIAHAFDERDPAVKKMLHLAISACRRQGKYVGICGQGPSDHPDLARWLLEEGISSISLNPDTMIETGEFLALNSPQGGHSG
ncbi:MAG: phosphoenolpyruvate synthase [Gammaproteobacteria bacterium]|nr:phosphoenolpyruvate synthase [Gammaproteobacteria bacterium]